MSGELNAPEVFWWVISGTQKETEKEFRIEQPTRKQEGKFMLVEFMGWLRGWAKDLNLVPKSVKVTTPFGKVYTLQQIMTPINEVKHRFTHIEGVDNKEWNAQVETLLNEILMMTMTTSQLGQPLSKQSAEFIAKVEEHSKKMESIFGAVSKTFY